MHRWFPAERAMSLRSLLFAFLLTLTALAAPVAASTPEASTPVSSTSSDCTSGTADGWTQQMDAYAAAGTYPAVQTQNADTVSSILVEVPKIEFTSAGQSSTLPFGPCQTIYRFAYSDITAPDGAALPFNYVEIDWNTEGEPRGPNGSFASPHFDFHYYMASKADIDQMLHCVSTNGRTCDQFATSYDQMRLFQDMPDAQYVPSNYRADVGSAIPDMGLHLLDSTFDYTLDNVNHTPTLIYGTFDGRVIFAESSVTLYTLQDVIAAPGQTLSYTFAQPAAFAAAIDWPTMFTITYLPDTGGFQAGFTNFVHHEATPAATPAP